VGTRQPGSPFDLPLDAAMVTKAKEALNLAQTSGGEVTLFTNGIPPQAVVAHLVFSRAGFGADRMAKGDLTQAEADSLVKAVEALAASKLLIVADRSPPGPDETVGAGFVVIGPTTAAS
jgi:replicative DNA helicase